MAQSLFVLMILSTLQICCRKKKAKTKTKTKAANVVVETSNDTTGNIAQTAPEINLQKTDEKANTKNFLTKGAKTNQKKEEQRKDDQTQVEGSEESDRDKADIIPMKKVKKMGNIDELCKEKKMEMEKEAEEIKSVHEMDNEKPFNTVMRSNLHVKIKENKCRLFETNDEPTLDDEGEEPLI